MHPVAFFDALRVKIRDEGSVKNKAVYLALGTQRMAPGMFSAFGSGARKLAGLRELESDHWPEPRLDKAHFVSDRANEFYHPAAISVTALSHYVGRHLEPDLASVQLERRIERGAGDR